jgi:uncharacterized membrane protein
MTETKNEQQGEQTENKQPNEEAEQSRDDNGGSSIPVGRLVGEVRNFGGALIDGGFAKAEKGIEGLGSKLAGSVPGGGAEAAKNVAKGDSPAKAVTKAATKVATKAAGSKVKDTVGKVFGQGGGDGGGKKLKVTNIVEEIDVPVPRHVAYDQWTQFEDFPQFMKKVEHVGQESDEKLTWQTKIFLSKRTWDAEIIEQVPDERIVWKSSGEKGYVNGAVTFHELTPDLTRITMVLEYHPAGLFEHTGNLWRAQGRRARLELKHFRRHVSTHTLLEQEQEQLEGWRGEIKDGEVQEGGDTGEDSSEVGQQSEESTAQTSDESDDSKGSQGKDEQAASRESSESSGSSEKSDKSA